MPEQTEVVTQVVATEQVAPAQSAPAEEAFDKERAMATINKLRETEKQARKDAAELASLKAEAQKRAEAEMTEVEKLKSQLAEQEKTTRATMAENAALAAGLPKEWADRLKGSTKVELETDAAEFAKLLPAQKPGAPKLGATNPQNPQQPETSEQMKQRLFGSQGMNIFDPKAAREHGGGVFG